MGFVALALPAQDADEQTIVRGIDAAVHARLDHVLAYNVTETYSVFRNGDETRPVAQMVVKTAYRKETGKTYTIQSESGSALIRKAVLGTILDNEQTINKPGVREGSWITSDNYTMRLRFATTQVVDGRTCYVLAITPKRKAPYLIDGTVWVDSRDDTIVQLQGVSSKSPSMFSAPTQMMRQYAGVNGYSMATHARAASHSSLFGDTVVTIDYKDYQMQIKPAS